MITWSKAFYAVGAVAAIAAAFAIGLGREGDLCLAVAGWLAGKATNGAAT